MSDEQPSSGRVDFALLYPEVRVTYECRGPGETLLAAIGQHIPDLATVEGSGPFRFYHSDPSAEAVANDLADTVSLGLGLGKWWWDLVAISMAPDPGTGEVPPLLPQVLDTLTTVENGIKRWGHTWGSTWNSPDWTQWRWSAGRG